MRAAGGSFSRNPSFSIRASHTSGKSGRGSYSGVKKKGSTDIAEAKKREYADSHGRTVTRIVNTQMTGGNGSRFAAHTFTGGVMGTTTNTGGPVGITDNPSDLGPIGQRFAEIAGTNRIEYELRPVIDDDSAFIRHPSIRVTTSSGRPRGLKALPTGFSTSNGNFEALSQRNGTQCVLCQNPRHSMSECLYAGRGGIWGCVLCNSMTHSVDECKRFIDMSLGDQVDLLVYSRGNRPALYTKQGWPAMLLNYLNRHDDVPPKTFPWSADYAKELVEKDKGQWILDLQDRWDETRDVGILPTDPAHASIYKIHDLYL
ncbi:hypothetical protein ACLX1H_003221 [Fusarium chlamydosporum]